MDAKSEQQLLNSLASNFIDSVNLFRRVHNTTPLTPSPDLQSKAKEIGANLYVTRDFDADITTLPRNVGCIVAKTPDPTFKPDFMVIQWYTASIGVEYTAQEYSHSVMNFFRIVWNKSRSYGLYLATLNNAFDFLVFITDNFDFEPRVVRANVYKPTIESKMACGFIDEETFKPLVLDIQNNIRKHHNVPDLIWTEELERLAKDISGKISNGTYDPPKTRSYGMLTWTGVEIPNAINIFGDWYETYRAHKYKTEGGRKDSFPYAQIVWKSTFACGGSFSKVKDTYIMVLLYMPPGNTPRLYEDNVRKPKRYLDRSEFLRPKKK